MDLNVITKEYLKARDEIWFSINAGYSNSNSSWNLIYRTTNEYKKEVKNEKS